jgi:hypothetical protein
MTEARFPKRRDDGSFVVFVRFSTSDDAISSLVVDYLKAWVRANKTWIRIWRSDSIEEERLEFDSEFLSLPRVETDPEGGFLRVVLEGRPSATRWKDWAAFMVGDLSKTFPELQFIGFDS